ncbi:hypothetical protein M404DRAFT_35882 [Pisolithus tinctorius Marx 270]|uniref:Uncharacterized protein n=1 Tax=Pisolithus tinctorius Marx 270 TaxID=870435 RepID=A0A0C3NCW1_PISTI|nr:hypothetical protein M404DRAFT_35882 [Pisolithus tinctorius Marx 270]
MLFSFPLDPDPSMIEIISDLIYANSTMLENINQCTTIDDDPPLISGRAL